MGKIWVPPEYEYLVEESLDALPSAEEVARDNRLFDDSVPGGKAKERLDTGALDYAKDYMRERRELQERLAVRDLPLRRTHSVNTNPRLTVRSWDGKKWAGELVARESLNRYRARWNGGGVKKEGKVLYRGGEIAEEIREMQNMRCWKR